jgi:large subunit ribosomal protein L25
MKTFELVGTPRSEYGKKAAKAFRKENLVPCNIYGNGENITFTVTVDDVRKLIYCPDTMAVALTIGETKKMAVVKELQFHPVTEQLFHIDFLEVTEDKPVTVAIPVQLQGHAEGVKAGGKLQLEMKKLKVNGIYTQIPNRVEIDVTNLGLGKKLYVEAVTMPEGIKLMNPADACVARVKATRASQQAAAAAAPAKGKKK